VVVTLLSVLVSYRISAAEADTARAFMPKRYNDKAVCTLAEQLENKVLAELETRGFPGKRVHIDGGNGPFDLLTVDEKGLDATVVFVEYPWISHMRLSDQRLEGMSLAYLISRLRLDWAEIADRRKLSVRCDVDTLIIVHYGRKLISLEGDFGGD
jgi:hypothetical protein